MTEQELRALDAQVAEKVMGIEVYSPPERLDSDSDERWGRRVALYERHRDSYLTERHPVYRGEYGERCVVPRYSTDIAAAFTVVEKMRERGYRDFNLAAQSAGYPWLAAFRNTWPWIQAWGDTAPLAICLASLQAVEDER